jgi:hypothetical protein
MGESMPGQALVFLLNGAESGYILAKEVSTMDRIISIEKDMIKILNMLFCLDSALLAFLLGVFFFCITDLSEVLILPWGGPVLRKKPAF